MKRRRSTSTVFRRTTKGKKVWLSRLPSAANQLRCGFSQVKASPLRRYCARSPHPQRPPDPAYQAQAVTGDGPLTDGSPLEFDVLSSTRQTASPTVVSSTAPSSASRSPLPASTVAVAIAASPTEASAAASPLLGSGGPPQLDADAQKAFAEWESLRRRAV